MKFVFEVVVRWCCDGQLKTHLVTAYSPDEALKNMVFRYGATSSYELRLDADHPWVRHKQKGDWKI